MDDRGQHKKMGMKMGYGRFAAMVATSTAVMFVLMYSSIYALGHIQFSQTRFWMALVMGAAMAIIMLGFMWAMYKNKTANWSIVAGSVVVFALTLWLVRSQETVGDISYMKAMVPHHSIAILTSERAQIRDPEVRRIADEIIDSQVREIVEMKRLIAKLEANPVPEGAPVLPSYRDAGTAPPPPKTDESTGIDTHRPIK